MGVLVLSPHINIGICIEHDDRLLLVVEEDGLVVQ